MEKSFGEQKNNKKCEPLIYIKKLMRPFLLI